MENATVLATALLSLLGGGAAVALINQWFVRRQTDAVAKKTTSEGKRIEIETSMVNWVGLIDERKDLANDLQTQVDLMRQRANEAENKVAEVQTENFSLREDVSKLKIKEIENLGRIGELERTILRMEEWRVKQAAEAEAERERLNKIIADLNGEVSALLKRVTNVEIGTGKLTSAVAASKRTNKKLPKG